MVLISFFQWKNTSDIYMTIQTVLIAPSVGDGGEATCSIFFLNINPIPFDFYNVEVIKVTAVFQSIWICFLLFLLFFFLASNIRL